MSELGYTVLLFSLPNYARRIGLDAQQGSIVGALLNLGLFVGRPILGHSSDTLGRINMATLTTGICGTICLLIWIFAKSFGVLCLFAILAGMVCGTFWATVAPVAADVGGLSELPSTLSIILVLMVVPTTCKLPHSSDVVAHMLMSQLTSIPAVAESIALGLRRSTGDIYLDAQIFTGFMFIAASICTLFLRSWKIGKVKEEAIAQQECESAREGAMQQQSRLLFRKYDSCLGRGGLAVKRLFELERV